MNYKFWGNISSNFKLILTLNHLFDLLNLLNSNKIKEEISKVERIN